ncbi:hypothetical protein NL676_031826 [Syzygium grande]|nr:hypothetical protein NL676_031826 [Syzygium grande]
MTTDDSIKGKVQRLCSLFESAKSPSRGAHEAQTVVVAHAPSKLKPTKSVDRGFDHGCSFRLLGKEDRIVVYFTSSEDVGGLLCREDDIKGIQGLDRREGCVDGLNLSYHLYGVAKFDDDDNFHESDLRYEPDDPASPPWLDLAALPRSEFGEGEVNVDRDKRNAGLTAAKILPPPLVYCTRRIFQPRSVKKSWDTINLILILFAIICGLLSRSNHGGDAGSSGSYLRSDSWKLSSSSNLATPYKWYDNHDRQVRRSEYGFSLNSSGRMRNSSSYPYLRDA